MQRTGELERARRELALVYGHTGYGTNRLDRVLEMYGRWHGRMDFRRWASTLYHPPQDHLARDAKTDAALAAGSALSRAELDATISWMITRRSLLALTAAG